MIEREETRFPSKEAILDALIRRNYEAPLQTAKLLAAQIAANNCYTDVKLGFLYDSECSNEEKEWEFARWLPHVWSEDKKTRYCASNAEQASDVFYELAKIFRTRVEEEQELHTKKEQLPRPYYILFISDMHLLEGELVARYIFDKEPAAGLTAFICRMRVILLSKIRPGFRACMM